MRKVINGRIYNTATSECIGRWDNGIYGNDFRSCSEDLYKNTKGAYFLFAEGGAMSEYAVHSGNNSWGGRKLIPLTATVSQEWGEIHLSVEDYEAEFGTQEEASPSDHRTQERVNLTLDSELIARLRKHSIDTGVPIAGIVDKAITYVLDKKDAE